MMVVMLSLLLSLSFVSAAAFNHRYQGPSDQSSASYYKVNYGSGYYNQNGDYQYYTVNQAQKPTFKGSYGNYRQVMYANGDYKPSQYFVDYPESFNKPYFSGGSGGYYGGYGLGSYGLGGFGGYGSYGYSGFGLGYTGYGYGSGYNSFPGYSSRSYGVNFYPSYDYSYGGCSYGC